MSVSQTPSNLLSS